MDATPHIIESALLLLAAFLLGCLVGYFARRMTGRRTPVSAAPAPPPPAPKAEAPAPEAAASPLPAEAAAAPAKAARASRSAPRKAPARKSAPAPGVKAASPLPDDLRKIRGIGPRIEAALNANGVFRYEQIAKWSSKTIAELDADLRLRGRIERDQWVEQAKALSKLAK